MKQSEIEKMAEKYDVPVIPKREVSKQPNDPNPVVAVCGECGMVIRKVMMYSCSNPNCPTGMGPFTC